jgi:hypothetical protein
MKVIPQLTKKEPTEVNKEKLPTCRFSYSWRSESVSLSLPLSATICSSRGSTIDRSSSESSCARFSSSSGDVAPARVQFFRPLHEKFPSPAHFRIPSSKLDPFLVENMDPSFIHDKSMYYLPDVHKKRG